MSAKKRTEAKQKAIDDSHEESTEPDWDGECTSCGQSPTHPLTGMCGPCTFGESDTIGGNW